jgi:hypothetical protein
MDGNHARQALENRATVDDRTRADRNADIVLGAAVIAIGLLAGLIYDWAITVMPALTAADDRTLVDAMQQTIDNPAFPLTFLGAGALAAGGRRRGRPRAVELGRQSRARGSALPVARRRDRDDRGQRLQ